MDEDSVQIGARARIIRRRRGMSLDAAAGLAGISKSYLSRLESGRRSFVRRGLVDDLAVALGCSVMDLTGQPYLPMDRATADALATLPAITTSLYETSLDEVPDVSARPVAVLAVLAAQANHLVGQTRYAVAGRDLGVLLTELHVQAVTGGADAARMALRALVEANIAACSTALVLGRQEIAGLAAQRGYDAARREPVMVASAAFTFSRALIRLGARRRAAAVLADGLSLIGPVADPTADDTAAAEVMGMLHLTAAHLASREARTSDADTHLDHAGELAAGTGFENNWLDFRFGPANVVAWSLAVSVEAGRGPEVAEQIDATPQRLAGLGSADRRSGLHLDLARGYAQAEGARDTEAIRHLDTADRIAPQRIRNDPIARDLVIALDRRAKRTVWELASLKRRVGIG